MKNQRLRMMSINSLIIFKNNIINVSLVLSLMIMSGCSSPEDKANKFYENGLKLFEKGELVKANVEFKNALQLNRKMTKARWIQVQIAEKQNKSRQQYKLLNSVLVYEPNHLQAIVKLGRLLLLAGQLDKALEKSDLAMKINNKDLSVLSLRAAIMLKLDDAAAAVEFAKRALATDPFYVDAILILASERMISGDAEKAIEYIERGLKNNDKSIALQLIKIKAFESLIKIDSAEEVFKKLIKYYPAMPAFKTILAQFYIKHGRNEGAENIFRTIVENNPDNLNAKIKLVQFIKATKGSDAALNQLKTFNQKNPDNTDLKFALVQFYYLRKEAAQANDLLMKIIGEKNDDEIVMKAKGMMAVSLLANGDKKAAEKIIDEIFVLDKQNQNALILKASIDIDRQKYDEAIGTLRQVLHDSANSSRALFFLARAHDLSGAHELADKQYFKAFKTSKFNSNYGLSYAKFLLKQKQHARAEKIIQNVLSVSQNNLPALKMLAQIRLSLGNWVGAQQVSDTIKHIGVKGGLASQISNAVLVGKKDYSKSISLLKKTYQDTPDNIQPVVALVRTYFLAGKKKEAGDFLDSVISASPNNMSARNLRSQVYLSQGETEKAINSYREIIEKSPSYAASYYHLALIYIKDKKYDIAHKILKDGLSVSPKSFSLGLTLAQVYEITGKTNKAIKHYEEMLELKPDADIVTNNLASLLTDNRTDKESLTKAYNISRRFKNSDIPQFKDTLGWASYRIGKYAEADSLLKSAIARSPNIPDFHYHLGMNYLAKEEKKLAREELEKALKLAGDNNFSKVKEIRATLEKI